MHCKKNTMIKRSDNMDQTKEQFRKIFIGGLNPKTDESSLKAFFSIWGEIVDVVVMKDKRSGRSRGFGFVTYRDSKSVDEAQLHRPHEIDGKIVETKRAMSRDDANNPESHLTVTKLFVGGLRKEVTADELQKYFTTYGNILECEIITWRESGESRGFGFVTFDDYDPVDKAVLSKPHIIGTSKTDVKKALSKDQISVIRKKEEEQVYHCGPPVYPSAMPSAPTLIHFTTPTGDVQPMYNANWNCYYSSQAAGSQWMNSSPMTASPMTYCGQNVLTPCDVSNNAAAAAALLCNYQQQYSAQSQLMSSASNVNAMHEGVNASANMSNLNCPQ